MPKYICFFSYTRDAAKAMIERPTDRIAAAKALVESVGGEMECFYWMHGHHDGFFIANYPRRSRECRISRRRDYCVTAQRICPLESRHASAFGHKLPVAVTLQFAGSIAISRPTYLLAHGKK